MIDKLENIGFYTLSDERAKHCSKDTPLWRCELLLTSRCNFKCPYCRGIGGDDLTRDQAFATVNIWLKSGLKNVRFSGGEPTLWKHLPELIEHCKINGVERIAISTNGSAKIELYEQLIACGCNDISISLDSCCASEGDKMAGGITGAWDKVIRNIRLISKMTYVTVGMVFTEDNIDNAVESILFADSLGVGDIRVVPSAQYNQILANLKELPSAFLAKYPILSYRINNAGMDRNVRKIRSKDCTKCYLALDDMAVMGDHHYPCIIHMREGGLPIGPINDTVRDVREKWVDAHNTHEDPICKNMCLDVCIDYNNKAHMLKGLDI